MTDRIREAVARAIAEEDGDPNLDMPGSRWGDHYREMADAAIAAHLQALKDAGYAVVPVEESAANIVRRFTSSTDRYEQEAIIQEMFAWAATPDASGEGE